MKNIWRIYQKHKDRAREWIRENYKNEKEIDINIYNNWSPMRKYDFQSDIDSDEEV